MGDMANGINEPGGFMATARDAAPLTVPAIGIATLLAAQGADAAEQLGQADWAVFNAAWDNAIVTTVADMRGDWDDAVADEDTATPAEDETPAEVTIPEGVSGSPDFNAEQFVTGLLLKIEPRMTGYEEAERMAYDYWYRSDLEATLSRKDSEALHAHVKALLDVPEYDYNDPYFRALVALELVVGRFLEREFSPIGLEDIEDGLDHQWFRLEWVMTELVQWLMDHDMQVYGSSTYRTKHFDVRLTFESAMGENAHAYWTQHRGVMRIEEAIAAGRIGSQAEVDTLFSRHDERVRRLHERFLGMPEPEAD